MMDPVAVWLSLRYATQSVLIAVNLVTFTYTICFFAIPLYVNYKRIRRYVLQNTWKKTVKSNQTVCIFASTTFNVNVFCRWLLTLEQRNESLRTQNISVYRNEKQKCNTSTEVKKNCVIPPSHIFGISRNQAEPAGMNNFQNSRHIREGISNPSHTMRGGMSRNDVGMDILYIFLDMRFGGVLNYVRTHSRANRDVPTAFKPHSSDNREIPTTFELHSSWICLISK